MNIIEWTAYNNSFILETTIKCESLKEAIIQAREFLKTKLKGEGTIKIYENNELILIDTKTKYGGYVTNTPYLTNLKSNDWWNKYEI